MHAWVGDVQLGSESGEEEACVAAEAAAKAKAEEEACVAAEAAAKAKAEEEVRVAAEAEASHT